LSSTAAKLQNVVR